MVSRKTAGDILAVMLKYIPDDKQLAMALVELRQVRGNQSFTDTVAALEALRRGQPAPDPEPITPAPEAQGRPDLEDRIALNPPEPVSGPTGPIIPAPEGRRFSQTDCLPIEEVLPRFIDIVAGHIKPENREFTVRVYQCYNDFGRHPNETLARTFPSEERARHFYVQTQNVWNMRVRGGEAPAFDVVLGVQDSRKHTKKKSYREWEHALCKGGPG
jgi:hypothetical protein